MQFDLDSADGTQAISAVSLPLPTGASTSAKQDTANASLAAIDAGIPAALGQTTMANSMPVVFASDQSRLSIAPSISKFFYEDMNAANGGVARGTAINTSYSTIYNRSNSGLLFGFTVSFEGNIIGADEFLVKLTVDSVVVFEISTSDIGTAAIYNFNSNGDANILGLQVANNNFIFKSPSPIKYSSTVKVEIKKASGSNKKFRAGLVSITKDT